MNEVLNGQASLLAYTHRLATLWGDSESIDFDAIADMAELPDQDLIGLRSFSLNSGSDYKPVATASGMIIVMTYNDAGNTRLLTRLNTLFNEMKPEKTIPLYDYQTSEIIGEMKFLGVTRLMPLERNGNRAIQGITFQAGLQSVS